MRSLTRTMVRGEQNGAMCPIDVWICANNKFAYQCKIRLKREHSIRDITVLTDVFGF